MPRSSVGIADHQRLALEIFAAELAQVEQRRRHHGGDDGGVEIGEGEAFQRQQLAAASTAYSSAVRVVSVTARHWARISSPS